MIVGVRIACLLGLLSPAWLAAFEYQPALKRAAPPAAAKARVGAVARPAAETPDKSIAEAAAAFTKAFNAGDAKAIASLWTPDGDYVDDSGERFTGREAIAQYYAAFFAEHPGAKIEIAIDTVRLVGTDTAIEDGSSQVMPAPEAPAIGGRYTVVHAKRDGKWLMASVRGVQSDSGESAELADAGDPLEDLAWMIGTWHAEHLGVDFQIECRWLANQSFVEVSYSRQEGEELTPTATQIIGVDPRTRQVTSWMFSGDGGYATGTWTPHATGWEIQFSGASADGTPTTAVNLLSRVHDVLVLKSTQRRIDGVAMPDTEEVVLKRK